MEQLTVRLVRATAGLAPSLGVSLPVSRGWSVRLGIAPTD